MKHLAAALAALALLASPVSASTVEDREQHINKFLTRELTPKEPWAHTKQVRVTDGWAQQPHVLKAAWVSFVEAKGYVKPPPPPPSAPTTPIAGVGASAGTEASSLYVSGPYAIPTYIVMCESGGN